MEHNRNNKNMPVALIAGGGTGGHLFPALAIGDELKNLGYHVTYIGSRYGLESKLLPKLNEKYHLFNIKGIYRTLSFSNIINNILFPYRFLTTYIKLKKIINKLKPKIIIGTGGYASGIPLIISTRMNIRSLIHEQNVYPGLTTRKLSHKVNTVCLTSEESKKYLNGNLICTGIPIRKTIKKIDKNKACDNLGLSINKKTIFILGGSQGSQAFNKHFENLFQYYLDNDIQIIWQCGYKHFNYYKNKINNPNILIKDFFDDINYAYSASDIIVSRAGAMALNEISFMSKPMILIPLPNSAGNHQFYNANNFQNNKAAIMINQNNIGDGLIEENILSLFSDEEKMKLMGQNANQLIVKNATDKIMNEIITLNPGLS